MPCAGRKLPIAGTYVSETVPPNQNLPLHPWLCLSSTQQRIADALIINMYYHKQTISQKLPWHMQMIHVKQNLNEIAETDLTAVCAELLLCM